MDLAGSFRRELRAENRAERTAVIYLQAVKFFSTWLTEQGRTADLSALNRPTIRDWLASLNERQAPATVRTRYRSLYRFCGWLVLEELIDKNPMSGIELPAAPATPVPVLSDADLVAILKACAGKRFYDRRDEAIIRFLLDTGVRVSEIVGLPLGADLDMDNMMAMVLGKGSKRRPVYFCSRTARALDRYLRMRAKHRYAHSTALFLGERGAMTTDGIREIVRIRAEKAGISHVHPHQFRHTNAHDFLLNGGQERDLKRLMGWSSDAMLERYGASAADFRAQQATRRLNRGDRV